MQAHGGGRSLVGSALRGNELLERRHGTSSTGVNGSPSRARIVSITHERGLRSFDAQPIAHAPELNAVGSSDYDRATAHFSPHGAGKSFMFVAVFGARRCLSTSEVDAKSRFLQGHPPTYHSIPTTIDGVRRSDIEER